MQFYIAQPEIVQQEGCDQRQRNARRSFTAIPAITHNPVITDVLWNMTCPKWNVNACNNRGVSTTAVSAATADLSDGTSNATTPDRALFRKNTWPTPRSMTMTRLGITTI